MIKKQKNCFKPYYNWNTFNTMTANPNDHTNIVLNLIITGIPSIPMEETRRMMEVLGFKPYYNWNTFNTITT